MCFAGAGCEFFEVKDPSDDAEVPDTPDAGQPDPDGDTVEPDGSTGDEDGGTTEEDGGPQGATLYIYVEGDLSPKNFNDGLSGQTPKIYTMSLSRYDIMTSADDPNPVTVFDYSTGSREIDMLGRTLAGQTPISDLPTGVYTHGRVRLTSTFFRVDATLHYMDTSIPGELDTFGVLSDTVIDGVPRQKGEATYTFMGQTMPGTLPELFPTMGGSVVEEPGTTWLVFSLLTPMNISSEETQDHESTIIYEVYESFRWLDLQEPYYQTGIFDVSMSDWEPVLNFGATGYRIEFN